MSKLLKKWAVLTAVLGGTMYQFGSCMGGQWRWIWAIAQEDIFG